MKIIVLIPILNPNQEFFDTIIPSLYNQTISPKIILVNSGQVIEKSFMYEIINIEKKDFNHSNTRNIILDLKADFYGFMTQDASPFNDKMIENLLNSFENKDVVVSYARQIPYEDAHITEKFARETNYPDKSRIQAKEDIETLGIKTFFSSDSCSMYRGDYFKKVGGFKKDLNCSEDMEFAARAIFDDKKVAYCAEAKVYHSHKYNIKKIFNRYFLIGRFLKENSWIEDSLKNSTKTESTGLKQVLKEIKYVLKIQKSAVFKSISYNLVKFLAYKIAKIKNNLKKNI